MKKLLPIEPSNLIFSELLIASMLIGLYFQSWDYFGLVLLLLVIILKVEIFYVALMICLSTVWAAGGYWIGVEYFESKLAIFITALFFLFMGIGLHFQPSAEVNDKLN